jgi:hypothetical protein
MSHGVASSGPSEFTGCYGEAKVCPGNSLGRSYSRQPLALLPFFGLGRQPAGAPNQKKGGWARGGHLHNEPAK